MQTLRRCLLLLRRTSLPATLRGMGSVFDHFEVGDVLGRGRFGVVKLAVHRASGRQYAVKTIARMQQRTAMSERILKNELRILKR